MDARTASTNVFATLTGFSLSLSLACATSPDSTHADGRGGKTLAVQQPFPSQARLDALSKQTVQQPLASVGTMAAVTAWSIDPSVPNADWTQPYTGDEPNSAAFVHWLRTQKSNASSSASMTCMAQQYARFTAEHPGAVAGDDLLTFMAARCGVPFMNVRPRYWTMPAAEYRALDPNAPLDNVMSAVDGVPKGSLAGLGVWKTDTTVVAAVLVAEPSVALQPVAFDSGATGSLTLKGAYDQPTAWMEAAITHGPLGHKSCSRVPTAGSRGAFEFRCPTNPQDASAVIELSVAPQGSVLGHPIARMLVSPDGSQPTRYEAPVLELPTTEGDFSSAAVLAGINALRGQAGLPDAMGAPAQDEVTRNLFPHIMGNENGSTQNEAAMGVIAGWQVDATVRGGSFDITMSHTDTPLDQALAGALFYPTFRAVVLGSDTHVLSTAVLEDTEHSLRGMMHVAFEVFEPGDFTAEENAVYQALDDARAKVALPPVTRVRGGDDEAILAQSADRIRTGESTPQEELDRVLVHFRDQTRRNFYGVIYSPMRIDGWTPEFNKTFFEHEKLAVSITVSYFDPPGAAWGQHVVIVVFTPL